MTFYLYAGEQMVGTSELPGADPPMGFVCGPFYPNPNYARIQPLIREAHLYDGSLGASNEEALERVRQKIGSLDLKIKTSTGDELHPAGGLHLTDFSVELNYEAIQLEVFGLSGDTILAYWRDAYDQYYQDS
jgi:hypothetical protein